MNNRFNIITQSVCVGFIMNSEDGFGAQMPIELRVYINFQLGTPFVATL